MHFPYIIHAVIHVVVPVQNLNGSYITIHTFGTFLDMATLKHGSYELPFNKNNVRSSHGITINMS